MKKTLAIVLALMMVLTLAACGAEEAPNADLVITRAPVEETPETEAPAEEETETPVEETEAPAADTGVYSFTYEGVELVPGASFDASVLPEAASLYEVPSCAIEGTDNVYNYETFEITAYNDGTGEVIYSIYFLDPNLTTAEGLAIGDEESKIVELYGEDYTAEGTSYIYTKSDTQLIVIAQNGAVGSIEYRMVTA